MPLLVHSPTVHAVPGNSSAITDLTRRAITTATLGAVATALLVGTFAMYLRRRRTRRLQLRDVALSELARQPRTGSCLISARRVFEVDWRSL